MDLLCSTKKIKNETLPNYTFLTPLISPYQDMYPNTQHPVYDIRGGDMLIKEVYESLRNSTYWNTTLLIITYDEHGGFWDKKAPPTAVNPTPNAKSDPDPFNFTRAGVRIPTILVSPWLPSAVDDVIYDLSSVPASIKKLFNLTAPFLSDRDAVANTFANQFLQQMRTDTPLTLPPPPSGPWCYPAKEKLHGLQKDGIDMYHALLREAGKEHLMPYRPYDIHNDTAAGHYFRQAQRILFNTKK